MLSKAEMLDCPVATTINLIGNKWKPLIIRNLLHGTQRYKEVLTENLRQLEEDGLVKREVFAEVPLRVEYSLTKLGEQMRPIINALADWGTEYKKQARKKLD